jgi:hypothetical protein
MKPIISRRFLTLKYQLHPALPLRHLFLVFEVQIPSRRGRQTIPVVGSLTRKRSPAKARMPEMPIECSLGDFDLGDEVGCSQRMETKQKGRRVHSGRRCNNSPYY